MLLSRNHLKGYTRILVSIVVLLGTAVVLGTTCRAAAAVDHPDD